MRAIKIGGIILLGVLAAWLYLAAFGLGLFPPTPPLLEGASGRGGWWSGGCTVTDERTGYPGSGYNVPEALSPELTSRLQQLAPPGSSSVALEEFLRSQGFSKGQPCANDPTKYTAAFHQQGGGLLRFPILAVVVWKADDGKVVWVKGHISADGL